MYVVIKQEIDVAHETVQHCYTNIKSVSECNESYCVESYSGLIYMHEKNTVLKVKIYNDNFW